MAALVTFVSSGDQIDYTPSSAVAAGDVVVQGSLIGIAVHAIDANTLGALTVEGVFKFPKSSAASSAIGAGVLVYWDPGTSQITATAGSLKSIGYTTAASVDADTTQKVRMRQ